MSACANDALRGNHVLKRSAPQLKIGLSGEMVCEERAISGTWLIRGLVKSTVSVFYFAHAGVSLMLPRNTDNFIVSATYIYYR